MIYISLVYAAASAGESEVEYWLDILYYYGIKEFTEIELGRIGKLTDKQTDSEVSNLLFLCLIFRITVSEYIENIIKIDSNFFSFTESQ